ncbi:MAG: phage regulatory CII family protein [Candidatus Omnitrophota bacterium]
MITQSLSQPDQKSKGSKSDSFSPYNIAEENILRRGIYSLFKDNPKTVSADLKLSYSFLRRVGDLNLPFRFSVRALLPLLRLTGDSTILSFMAGRLGFQIYKLPEEVGARDLESALADFSVTLSSVQQQMAEASQRKDRRALDELEVRLEWLLAITVRLKNTIKEFSGEDDRSNNG